MTQHTSTHKLVLITWLLVSATATSVVCAQVPGGCNTPVSQRTSEVGCYLTARGLGSVAARPSVLALVRVPNPCCGGDG